MFLSSIFFLLPIAATLATFLPRSYSRSLNSSLYPGHFNEGLSPNVITPLPYSKRFQKQQNPAQDEFSEVERSIEEEPRSIGGEHEAPPPDVSRMPSFYRRRGGYGSNLGRGCVGPGCPFIRPPAPYAYGSNYMGSSLDRYDMPYPPTPMYRPSPMMMYRRPRRPYFGPGPETYSSMPSPPPPPPPIGPNYPYGVEEGAFRPVPYGQATYGYGRLPKSPMDWQDNGMAPDISNGPMNVMGPEEVNNGPIEDANPNGSSRPPEGEVGVYMSSYGYSYAGYIERQAKMYPIMMYTLVQCIPCQRAKHLLAISYADVRSHFLELVGNEDWQRQLQVDLQHITGAVTFPYIFICGTYIGGSSDLFQLHQTGQLRRMVSACSRRF